MSTVTSPPIVNHLLASLPSKQRNRIMQNCEPVELVFGTVLCEPGQCFRNVYFPLTGFISLVSTLHGHQPLEMGMIGNEGMLGATLALGIDAVPLRAVVQGTGSALRLSTVQLRQALQNSEILLRTLNRYLYVLMTQLSQTTACTRFHKLEARLARWLLMTHDRAHADHFHLTHEFLADMLGVRRSGITVAAGVLQKRKIIRYARGQISILDRKALEAVSCGCYQPVVSHSAKILN
jgi:CRP-like cAMP-binding protein